LRLETRLGGRQKLFNREKLWGIGSQEGAVCRRILREETKTEQAVDRAQKGGKSVKPDKSMIRQFRKKTRKG